MCKIIRWAGYLATLVGFVLIIWACFGSCCNHSCSRAIAKTDTVCCKHHSGSATGAAKADSVNCKHSTSLAKTDTACCKDKPGCSVGEMTSSGCHRYHHINLFEAAISFLVLAIALFIISKNCCCKKCCGDNECKCETKEEKKEA